MRQEDILQSTGGQCREEESKEEPWPSHESLSVPTLRVVASDETGDRAQEDEVIPHILIAKWYRWSRHLWPFDYLPTGHAPWNTLSREDAVQEAVLHCWLNSHKFDLERGSLSTFYWLLIKQRYSHLYQKAIEPCRKPVTKNISLDFLRDRYDGFDVSEDYRIGYLMQKSLDETPSGVTYNRTRISDEVKQRVIRMREEGNSWGIIEKATGLNRGTSHRIVKKATTG